ncbi:MAG: hypothetical protein IPM39_20055 [Chloroflexi bacterium]|nr:hypothetical protein [Chloroflexota bacterium]
MEPPNDPYIMDKYQAIMASGLAEVDKVKEAFSLITDAIIRHGEQEIELRRAMNDRENLIKEQIKLSTVRTMRGVFSGAYHAATGSKPWENER